MVPSHLTWGGCSIQGLLGRQRLAQGAASPRQLGLTVAHVHELRVFYGYSFDVCQLPGRDQVVCPNCPCQAAVANKKQREGNCREREHIANNEAGPSGKASRRVGSASAGVDRLGRGCTRILVQQLAGQRSLFWDDNGRFEIPATMRK